METTSRTPSPTLTSILLYLALPLLAFFHCLILGQSYFANDLLYGYGPFRAFLKEQLAAGHFPLWNPYQWAGQPFFADPNNLMVYPLNYLTLLLPLGYGYSVFYFIHMALAALGMHVWLKSLRMSDNACRLGALLYALSGFFWWELIHLTILACYALFPWFLAALERLVKEPRVSRAFAVGLSYAFIFNAGNFQIALGIFYTGVLYFVFRAVEKDGFAGSLKALGSSWKKVLGLGLIALWGSLPLFLSLIPTAEMAKYSVRESALGYEKFAATFSLRPGSLTQFIYPFLGVPEGQTLEGAIQQITDPVNVDNNFLGALGYLGLWAPFLAACAFRRKEKKLLYLLGGLALLAVLVALGRYFPLHRLVCAILPGFDLVRAPFRFVDTYLVCLAALAAYGYQTLDGLVAERKLSPNWTWVALGYGSIFLAIGLSQPSQTWREMLAAVVGCSGFALWTLTESWKPLGKSLFLGAVVLPLLFAGWAGYGWGHPSNLDYKSKYPVASTLWQGPQAARFALDAQNIPYPVASAGQTLYVSAPQNLGEVFHFHTPSGYNPLTLKKTNDLVAQMPEKTYIQLMGIHGLLSGINRGDLPHSRKQPLDLMQLYVLEQPGDYVQAPFKTRVIADEQPRLAALKDPAFDPTQEALLDQPLPAAAAALLDGKKAQVRFQLAREEADGQLFRVALDRPSLLVFSEIMFPGWKAWLDGKPAELFTANHTFRALVVPAGDHEVTFHYEPSWANPLKWAGVSWLLSALLFGGILWRKRGRPALAPANP